MEKYEIRCEVAVYKMEELSTEDRQLVEEAQAATDRSYSPYSHFKVGAALRLANDKVITGSNQENASYPLGLCAERTTIFHAQHQYPDQPIVALAIAAKSERGFTEHPTPPCGACRQVMIEVEDRYKQPIRLILFGTEGVHVLQSAQDLMPLHFIGDSMK